MKKIDKKLETIEKNEIADTSSNRRDFLKKAAYSAPVLLLLGQLVKPTKAQADSGDPVGPPNWGGF
jgi:hypothetical protein